MKKIVFIFIVFILFNCSKDDSEVIKAGVISGGPYIFCVDELNDNVTGISFETEASAKGLSSWLITDNNGVILRLPLSITALEMVNFDSSTFSGDVFIRHLKYAGEIEGLEVQKNINSLKGDFDLSNAIKVSLRAKPVTTIMGGPFEFIVDGTPDFALGVSVGDLAFEGSYLITDGDGIVLRFISTQMELNEFNFEAFGVGEYSIYYLFQDNDFSISGLMADNNIDEIRGGCYTLVGPIMVSNN